MRKFFLFALLFLPLSTMAQEKPPELAHAIHSAQPVGSSSFSKLLFHVYDASFWSDSGNWANPPYALSITYAMDFSRDDLVERTVSEMKHLSDTPQATLDGYGQTLNTIWPDIKEGDRITALANAKQQTLFYANGKAIGQINDPAFTKLFFSIWLSPKSSEPAMRKALLGK